uniref:Abasic site processing protein HMCES n=1 Tax=Romanomermis culicivorax TaxID=13658 RepID=A0A915HXQ7_ROMCU
MEMKWGLIPNWSKGDQSTQMSYRMEKYPIHTFTVITVPSSKIIASIHDRMPAILPDWDSVQKWLDCNHVSVDEIFQQGTAYAQNGKRSRYSYYGKEAKDFQLKH